MKRFLFILLLSLFASFAVARPDEDAPPVPQPSKQTAPVGVAPAAENVYSFLFADLASKGYKVECSNPRAWYFDTDDWNDAVDKTIGIIDTLGFDILGEGFLEPEVAFVVLDINPDDPTAYGMGILLLNSFSLQDCHIFKP